MKTQKLTKIYIDAAKFEAIIREVQARQETEGKTPLVLTTQAGFVKLSGATGRNIYVANTNRVARVDISGFEMPEDSEDVIVLGSKGSPMDAFGAVKQCLNTFERGDGRDEEKVLQSFRNVVEHMLTLEPVVKASKAKGAPGTPKATGWSREVSGKPEAPARMTAEQKKERKALLQKVAKEKGMEVSPNAFKDASTETVEVALNLAGASRG